MKFSLAIATAVAAASVVNGAWSPDNTSGTDLLAAKGLTNLEASQKAAGVGKDAKCSIHNAVVRKEW